MFTKKEDLIYVIFFLALLAVFLLMGFSVNFMQNDEWVHYKAVLGFMKGDFSLPDAIGSTFYSQGVLALFFSYLIGFKYLPVLTAIISWTSIVLLFIMLNKFYNLSRALSVFISLLVAFNPIYFYLSIGFMTDNYAFFFLILSLFFYKFYQEKSTLLFLAVLNLFLLLGFLQKQYFLAFYFSLLLSLICKKSSHLVSQLVVTILVGLFYIFLFPKTGPMDVQFNFFDRLANIRFIYELISVVLIYSSFFLFPIYILSTISTITESRKIKRGAFYLFLVVIIVFIWNMVRIGEYFLADFPYLQNVFTRKGFYPYGLSGNKYHWVGNYDVFEIWSFCGKLLAPILAITLFPKVANAIFKQHFDFETFSLLIYVVLIILAPTVYDRYLLPVFLFTVLAFLHSGTTKLLEKYKFYVFPYFIFLLMFIDYQYAFDYMLSRRYIVERSNQITNYDEKKKKNIISEHALNNYYEVNDNNANYIFTFDSPDKVELNKWQQIEAYKIEFLGSVFISPYIYLYQRTL